MPDATFLTSRSFKRAFVAISSVIFALTFLKGFRPPSLWGATHFALNYSQGFVRRGLIGEIARRIGGDDVYRYNLFVIYAFVVFTTAAVLLGLALRAALRADPTDLGFRAAVLVFGASSGLVFFVHTVGYNDYIGFVAATALLLFTARTRARYAIFYLTVALSLVFAFVHEALVVMFGPAMVFMLLCHILRTAKHAPLKLRDWLLLLGHTAVAGLLMFALSSLVSTLGTEDAARIAALQRYIAQHADFTARADAFQALARSSKENLTKLMPGFWSYRPNRIPAYQAWWAFAPTYLWLVGYAFWATVRADLPRLGQWALRAGLLGACVAPLLLNFVGWDWNRWNGLALLSCFLCILALKIVLPAEQPRVTPVPLWTAGLIATVIALSTTSPLFDGFVVQFFPFDNQWSFLRDWTHGDFKYRPRL